MSANILFIMCDQLRRDYLSCYGHPTLDTPNIDSLAAAGVRFNNAYCQAPLCGPSRTSYYTGRYMSSHGVMANEDMTRIDEMTMGDYLRPLGYRSALVGKADSRKSPEQLAAFGMDLQSPVALAASCGGFEPFEHHEGVYPDPILPPDLAYNAYLKAQGYGGHNPWHEYANSGLAEDGQVRSGWQLRHSHYPARVAEEHSETAFTTNRAIDFLEQQSAEQPWLLHLSYIKPHWPLIAPAPYHDRYGVDDLQPVVRDRRERQDPHPVYDAFAQQEYSLSYARDDVRNRVIPAYMGLVKQVDDQLGRLFDYMRQSGLLDNTLIVLTADHGDYLGDHWLGEKDLFHEPSAGVPMILVDPHQPAQTRGTASDALVEGIDLAPTFIDFAGGEVCRERLEGRSLLPLLRSANSPADWRPYAVSEIDFSDRGPRGLLDLPPYDCRAVMIRDQRWKYIHHNRFRAQLFDLENDPQELHDLGADARYGPQRAAMQELLVDWLRRLKPRTGQPFERLADMGPERDETFGIVIGRW